MLMFKNLLGWISTMRYVQPRSASRLLHSNGDFPRGSAVSISTDFPVGNRRSTSVNSENGIDDIKNTGNKSGRKCKRLNKLVL